ncbi:MAG: MBL fold metallo-hydrolase [Oxalobacteraceae bacterium]|nr:MBL fold metallo-hydrolase [Oxalobacteraceae bacterium]
MNPQESELEYVFGETLPATGTTLEVAPGVRWLRMGLPFALNHINLWLLEDVRVADDGSIEHGWTIVDCGIASDATRDAWELIFANELRGLPVWRVIVTHCHPDHVGLSAWLCERWQVPMYMTVGEYGFARMMAAGLPGADGPSMLPHFQQHGLVDEAMIAQITSRQNYYPTLVPDVPQSFIRLEASRPVMIGTHHWQVIIGTGHSPEHAALYCADLRVLISGDMVLPRISTNTSVFAVEPESDAVGNFLDSIQKFSALPEQTLVLPSHGKPFRGLHTRIAQLAGHHADRLAEVKAACATPQSAADIVPIMFRRELDAHQLTFAMGEALAHLHRLWYAGELRRFRDDRQVWRFVNLQ